MGYLSIGMSLVLAACIRSGKSEPDTGRGQSDDSGQQAGTDADGDGCASVESGGDDCDDTDEAVHPGADEFCDGVDDDCDGQTDESDAVDASVWYADADGDGYGDASSTVTACAEPDGFVENALDCDDTHAQTRPDAGEACDGVDNNCDGDIDEDGVCGTWPWGEVELSDADARLLGTWEQDHAGAEVALAGDVNGDGRDEIRVGAPSEWVLEPGVIYLVAGQSDPATSFPTSLGGADVQVQGEDTDDHAGRALAGAGDFDGDGYADIVVGVAGHDETDSEGEGAVYLLLGSPDLADFPASLGDAFARVSGEDWYDSAGTSVAGAGDVDGDGYDDLLVGAPGYNSSTDGGAVYLIRGRADSGVSLGLLRRCPARG